MSCLLDHLGMHSIPLRIALLPIFVAPYDTCEPWLRSLCIAVVRRPGEFVDGEAQWYSCKCEVEAPLIHESAIEAQRHFQGYNLDF